jgi:hypothetical protein
METVIHRDTKAWQIQVWASFGTTVFLCAVGLAYLPGTDLDRVFMVMGYFFCLSNVFVLAKFVRDNEKPRLQGEAADSTMFKYVVWGGFFLSMGLTGWGMQRMDISGTYKAFLFVCWLFLVSSAFTLAKTLRDKHEADLAEARISGRDDDRY